MQTQLLFEMACGELMTTVCADDGYLIYELVEKNTEFQKIFLRRYFAIVEVKE